MNAEDFRTKAAEDFSKESPFCFAYVTAHNRGTLFRSKVIFLNEEKMKILGAILAEHTGYSVGMSYLVKPGQTKSFVKIVTDSIAEAFKSWIKAGKIVP